MFRAEMQSASLVIAPSKHVFECRTFDPRRAGATAARKGARIGQARSWFGQVAAEQRYSHCVPKMYRSQKNAGTAIEMPRA